MTASTSTMTRRGFLVAATVAAPAVLASCVGAPSNTPGTSGTGQAVSLTFEGRPVRCLVHRAGKAADAASTLTIVLLHGANTNASQWDDIGLAGVMADVDLSGPISSVVTIAPDIVDHSRAKPMVIETVAPFVARHWGQTNLAIGGISRGAAVAFDVAESTGSAFRSVGLHSPALDLAHTIPPQPWVCWLDVGSADGLVDAAARAAAVLRASGVVVVEHHWSGGHDRRYWRAHLPEYVGFHLAVADGRPL